LIKEKPVTMSSPRRKTSKPIIAITCGDINGIGPEVALKALANPTVHRICDPILIGPTSAFDYYRRRMPKTVQAALHSLSLIDALPSRSPLVKPGTISVAAGRIADAAIRAAAHLALAGKVQAIVTSPVSKKALHKAGGRFPGQTEMLQAITHAKHGVMILVSGTMRVGLVTTHVPINDIATSLSVHLITKTVNVIHHALSSDWLIGKPRIAILSLNPHAGEHGDIGTEDRRIVIPAIKHLQTGGLLVSGPFPADSFFGRYTPGVYDAIVAMYHDQGLIPVKMSARSRGVNVTVGLPIIRTSPDHGTAFDIAGKGAADPGSMIEAIRLAAQLAKNRMRGRLRD
jgi:4-hydroxythreonine-4-phosphate dehydrogenase